MANDIIDINVYETTETVSITVNPNLTTININEVTGVGGSQNLQSVTNFGNTTTTSITANSFIKSGGTGANVLLDNGATTVLANLGTKNDINSKQLQLNYLDRDNSIFDAFYLRTIADGGTVEASNQLLSSLAVLRNISYVNQGYTQQINADKFVKLGGTSAQYLMADGSVTTGGGGGGATNLAYTPSPTNGIVTSDTGTDATIPLADVTNAGLLTPSEKTKIANSVPYTGATSDVNLGEFGIQLGNLEFDNTPTNIPTTAGSVYYNDSDGTLDLILKGGNVKLQIGQESVVRVVNKTSTNIDLLEANYQAVRVTGAQGQRLKVDLAQATNDVLSAETIGLVTETITNNQEGFITTSGLVRNINTTGSLQSETWLDGDVLYLSPTVAGRITKVKPQAPNHLVIIGYVIYAHATQGTIFVKVDNGYELDELHNVKIDTPANNNVLSYTLATDIWENKTIATALGYTPANDISVMHLAGTETITGVKTFGTNLKTTIPFNSIPTIAGIAADGGLEVLYTGIYPDQTEISYVKGVTSGIQSQFSGKQPLSTVLTNTTASFTIADETKLDGIATGATANSSDATLLARANHTGTQLANTISDFDSSTRGQVEAELVAGTNITITPSGTGATRQLTIAASGGGSSSQSAFTVLANNTNASAVPTEQVFKNVAEQTYTPTPSWNGTTAPSGTTDHTYMWSQVGNLVTLRINLSYSVAGSSLSSVVLALPSDLPTPETPSSVTVVNDVVNYGSGMLTGTKVVPATPTAEVCALRLKTLGTPNVFEIYIGRASAAHRYAYAFIQYFV